MTEHQENTGQDPFVDAADVTEPAEGQIDGPTESRTDRGDKIAEDIRRIASDTAYAAAGFAGLVGEKAKEFYDEQRRQYTTAHPEAESDPGAKAFLTQMKEKINAFVEELSKSYREMAERGRSTHEKQAAPQAADDLGDVPPADDVTTTDGVVTDPTVDEAPTGEVFGEEVVVDDTVTEAKPEGETFVDPTVADDVTGEQRY